MSDRSPDSSTVVATASGEAANGQARSPWGTVLRAGVDYIFGLLLGAEVWVFLPGLLCAVVYGVYYPEVAIFGDEFVWFFRVFWLTPFAGSALGIFALVLRERQGIIPDLRSAPGVVPAIRGLLWMGLVLPIAGAFVGGIAFAVVYWIAGGMIVTLATRALGLGLPTQMLASLSMSFLASPWWTLFPWGSQRHYKDVVVPAFVEPSAAVLGCLLFGSLLLASRRPDARRASRGAAEITRAVSEPTGRFYYLGPDDEPVGPVSREVLSQLRRAGAVTAETFVAREGEENWETCARHASLSEREAD